VSLIFEGLLSTRECLFLTEAVSRPSWRKAFAYPASSASGKIADKRDAPSAMTGFASIKDDPALALEKTAGRGKLCEDRVGLSPTMGGVFFRYSGFGKTPRTAISSRIAFSRMRGMFSLSHWTKSGRSISRTAPSKLWPV
jgi:hypothetical protein